MTPALLGRARRHDHGLRFSVGAITTVASGILTAQSAEVIAAAASHGLKLADERTRGE